MTEVNYDGTKSFEMIFDEMVFSYRAFRHSWRTNLFTSDRYYVNFGFVAINDTGTEQVMITNNSDQDLLISNYSSRSNLFSVVDEFPIILQPFENKTVQIQFSPDTIGIFSDDIHLRIEDEDEMIAQVISVSGSSEQPVPVELTSFNAVTEPGKVKLTWSTATEIINLGFEIERVSSSTTPLFDQWLLIGFIPGSGSTTEPKEYSYIDNVADITAQSLVYRLKQIDFNGTYEYSDKVLVDNLVPD